MRPFAVLRPYDERFRARVFAFLRDLGFDTDSVQRLDVRTPDHRVADWLRNLHPRPDLFLIPYHQHRDEDGRIVDGLSALEGLGEDVPLLGQAPLLMPVSDYAFASSFARRIGEFEARCPLLARRIVVMPAARIGDPAIRSALLTALS